MKDKMSVSKHLNFSTKKVNTIEMSPPSPFSAVLLPSFLQQVFRLRVLAGSVALLICCSCLVASTANQKSTTLATLAILAYDWLHKF